MSTVKLVRIGLVAGTWLALAATASMAQDKVIRVATEGAYAPYNFMSPDGKLQGFEIDLTEELCKRAKLKCEMVRQNWEGIIPGLQAEKFDAIISAMSVTPKREAVIDFSISYVAAPGALLAPKSSPLAKLPDTGTIFNVTRDQAGAEKAIEALKPFFKGKVIGIQSATTHVAFFEQYLKGVAEVREYKTAEQPLLDLQAGRIDGVWGVVTLLRESSEKPDFKDFALVGPQFSGGVFGRGNAVGVRKGDERLKTAFSEAIASMLKDGSLQALSVKWFKLDITTR